MLNAVNEKRGRVRARERARELRARERERAQERDKYRERERERERQRRETQRARERASERENVKRRTSLAIFHEGSCSRNRNFFLRSPISYTPSCPNRLPTNLAVQVVTTMGRRKCTFAVPWCTD